MASVPEAELTDLRKRINATKWPEREPVADASQGVQLAAMQKLARYWGTDYDWRKCEAALKALPQFITEIDGLDIHFIHVRSRHQNALPLIVTHGWPGFGRRAVEDRRAAHRSTAIGGSASDAFDIVIPSMPGYGYSGKPATTGWDCPHIARAWIGLMKRLGYTKFVAQGGDWGAFITEQMGVLAPSELLGIHVNLPSAVPAEIIKALGSGDGPPPGLAADEKYAFERLDFLFTHGLPASWHDGGAAHRRCTRLRIRRSGSPPGSSNMTCSVTNSSRAPSTDTPKASRETTSSTTSRSPGYQHGHFLGASLSGEQASFFAPMGVKIPVAVSAFPDELYQLRGAGWNGRIPT